MLRYQRKITRAEGYPRRCPWPPSTLSLNSYVPLLHASTTRTMRVKTLEIRWHDSKPISTCAFQPVPFKKARPTHDKSFATQTYKLATGGEDNHVRVCAEESCCSSGSPLTACGSCGSCTRTSSRRLCARMRGRKQALRGRREWNTSLRSAGTLRR